MNKAEWDKAKRRLRQHAVATMSAWKRLVLENDALQDDIKLLRRRYQLPITYAERKRWQETWRHKVKDELKAITESHNLDWARWNRNLYEFMLHAERAYFFVKPNASIGVRISKDEIVIDPVSTDHDVNNPLFWDEVNHWHRKAILLQEPPPLPFVVDEMTGEKDWRPVREWLLNHPDITYEALEHIYKELYPNENTPRAHRIIVKVGELGGNKIS